MREYFIPWDPYSVYVGCVLCVGVVSMRRCEVGLGGLCRHNFEHNGSQIDVSIIEHNGSGSDNDKPQTPIYSDINLW